MKNRLVYENLDTSFVNLAALVRFLRARKFVGDVSVELGEYTGEIVFTAENEMRARERDRVSGRVAEGEDALQRLLIRAREPGGSIHVHQAASETINTSADAKNAAVESPVTVINETILPDITVSTPAGIFQQPLSLPQTHQIAAHNRVFSDTPHLKSTDFPFEFRNKVEAKARQPQLSEADWQTLLRLTAKLLQTIDDSLAQNNLNFQAAFQKARAETSSDYPFLDPNTVMFVYQNGEVEVREQVNAQLFAAAINETLRRILEKLAANPKFAEPYRDTAQKILALVREHKPLFDKFFITPQLEKILGV
jgi:hypothetical protein